MTPLLFLPGMMCDARLFAPQIAALSAHRAIMSCPAGGHDSMQALAGDILSYAPPRFALAGLSMGGILAMEVLRQAPDRITRLALMDTNPLAELDEVKARRGPQIAAVQQGRLADVMRDQMIPNYLHAPDPDGPIPALCLRMALDLGPQVFVNQSLALRDRPDQTQVLRDYRGPTLILCGESDRLCPVARHRLMHELLPHATLQIVSNAGHLPVLEQPEHTTALLRRWLEEL